jgi:hypothetical protein
MDVANLKACRYPAAIKEKSKTATEQAARPLDKG